MFELDPRLTIDTEPVCDLALSRVLLMNECQFPWLILVPRRSDIREIYELDEPDRTQLQAESHLISKTLMEHFEGEKLNIGALGNMVPQLHIHHIVRFANDAAWPDPVWGNFEPEPYQSERLKTLLHFLRQLLDV